ncbi:hypothetical protein O3M35_005888 [Rhynocoris fuscipes]|uniref:gamma-glutamylcyclotransferase n=1 Tax=Rhynocoris fuscipes TaxID=488301 RepID=A0AAW1DRP4_9HEMI
MSGKKILYWAYCANMLANRMECCVHKSVKRLEPAQLKDHILAYGRFSPQWYGTLPTIIKYPNGEVWGSIWELDESHQKLLDELQGVNAGIYEPIKIEVVAHRGVVNALTYKLVENPPKPEKKYGIPLKKYRPSKIYKEQMIAGAVESCLPLYYRKQLLRMPDNGYTGSVLPVFDDRV